MTDAEEVLIKQALVNPYGLRPSGILQRLLGLSSSPSGQKILRGSRSAFQKGDVIREITKELAQPPDSSRTDGLVESHPGLVNALSGGRIAPLALYYKAKKKREQSKAGPQK